MIPLSTWQRAVVECLQELSDLDLQRKAWLDANGPVLPDPGELICQLFDDSGLGDELQSGEAFAPECDTALRELDQAVVRVDVEQPPRELLGSEPWHEITRKAAAALNEIRKIYDCRSQPS
jgi:hypothetical protein